MLENNISFNNLRNDPYEILIDEIGLSFKKADLLGLECFKCDPNLKSRLIYITEIIVNKINCFGDTYSSKEKFIEEVNKYNLDYETINELIVDEKSRVIEIDGDKIQTKELYNSEKNIPLLLKSFTNHMIEQIECNNLIAEYEELENIKLELAQKEAVKTSINNQLSIICGGAGTGKTTIIKCILFILDKFRYGSILLAPTGKASRRMNEATNKEAFTCHRYYLNENVKNPLVQNNKLNTLIIDECSMIDTILLYNVLKSATESETTINRIIFVGDSGQLPSVGAGNVFGDMIKSNIIPMITLETSKRCHGNIIKIANNVRWNQTFDAIKENDFFVQFTNNTVNYIMRCWTFKRDQIKNDDKLFDDLQICTSSNSICNTINIEIQKIQNNIPLMIGKISSGFCIHDKIMNIKNDYENEVMNGEFGVIVGFKYLDCGIEQCIKNNEHLKRFNETKNFTKNHQFVVYYSGLNKFVTYDLSFDDLSNFKLAYCCTIHKLQGSEFNNVICDLSTFNLITDSRLLYTAITRAKKKFILLTDSITTLNNICKSKKSSKRKTLLLENLLK
jgi:exodeoxyribonuclease V alpha subunit